VPSGASGIVPVSIQTIGGSSSLVDYHVIPFIAGTNPSSAHVGSAVTISGTAFGPSRGTSHVYFGSTEVTSFAGWSDTGITCDVPACIPGDVPVTVITAGGASSPVTFQVEEEPTPPPSTPPPEPPRQSTWYLAEGTTAYGFSEYITIANPNDRDVTATVTYMPSGTGVKTEELFLPGASQTTLTNDHLVSVLGNVDFSTKVEAKDGSAIAVDRTMTWTGTGASSPEAHSSVGVTSPEKTWFMPEGSTNWNFETWLLIQNPNAAQANVDVTYMIEGEGPRLVKHTVMPNSRASFSMQADVGNKDASIKVESDQPVIPERAMYRNNRREGHDSIGTTSPEADYYLAEGACGYNVNYVTYVLVQNPNAAATDVTISCMTGTGQVAGPSFTMQPNSRRTIKVNDALPPNTDVSTRVHGSAPIIAERAMYWNNGSGEACHDSIGMASPHKSFYLPDGEATASIETWTLVQNPAPGDVSVEVTYLGAGGTGNVTKTETIGANSRKTFNMAEHSGITGRAAITVTSRSTPIMVERAMYRNNRGAGTDTIGGYSD